jgi:CBS domain-containing protein
MAELEIGCLPVVDAHGHALGVLTRTDVLNAVAEAIEDEALFGET